MPVDIFYVAFYDRTTDQIYYPAYVEGESFLFDPRKHYWIRFKFWIHRLYYPFREDAPHSRHT